MMMSTHYLHEGRFILALELEKAGKVALRLARRAEDIFNKSSLSKPLKVFESIVNAYPHYFRYNKEAPRGVSAKWLCNPARWRARFRKEIKQLSIELATRGTGCFIVPDVLVKLRERELNLSLAISAVNAVLKGHFKSVELASNHLNKWYRLQQKRSSIFALVDRTFVDDSYLHVCVITVKDPFIARCPQKAATYLRAKAHAILECHRHEDPNLSFVSVFECHASGVPHLNLLIFRQFKSVNVIPEPDTVSWSKKELVALRREVWERSCFNREEAFRNVKYFLKSFQKCNRSSREEAFFSSYGIQRFRIFDAQKHQRKPPEATAALGFDDKSVQEMSSTPRLFVDTVNQATIRGLLTRSLANSMGSKGSIGKLLLSFEALQLQVVKIEQLDEHGQGRVFSNRFVLLWQELTKVVMPEPRAPPTRRLVGMADHG